MALLVGCSLLMLGFDAQGSTREGGEYTLTTETQDSGGGHGIRGGEYEIDSSIGMFGGLSTAGVPETQAKQGYAGQLYDVTSVRVTADSTQVDENTSVQLEAEGTCDDSSVVDLDGKGMNWSVVEGPIETIAGNGRATAGFVFADTAATVQGAFSGISTQLGLMVINRNLDDYLSYAGDGIDDNWQVEYFGVENPDAGPFKNPDSDPSNNFLEFLGGFDPTDFNDWCRLSILSAGSGTADLEINKVIPDRTYVLKAGNSPDNLTETVATFSVADKEAPRAVHDPSAGGDKRFYQLTIKK